MGFIKLVVIGFVALTIVYWSVSIYSRSVRREKLEKSWSADHPQSTDKAARDDYIAKGMADYDSGFRKKLIFLVYVVPVVTVSAILILTNTN